MHRFGRKLQRPLFILLALFFFAGWSLQSTSAETWAERLGFPADKKVVILHAHDMGMCYATNVAGEQLLSAGHVRSVSAMAPCPWFDNFARWSREHADADVGLQLTLNSELDGYRWGPVAADRFVPSLIDVNGHLWRSVVQVTVNAQAADVESELRAQIDRAIKSGMRPSHLTTHLGALFSRPDLIDVYLRLAQQYWIPAVAVEITPEHIERFRDEGFPLPDSLIRVMADYPLPKVDDLQILGHADSYDEKKKQFLNRIHAMPNGLTQFAFAPAVETEALKQIAPDWQQRVWEAKMFEDGEVIERLHQPDVILTDWRELMRRFEGRPPKE